MPAGSDTIRTRDGWEVRIRPGSAGDEAAWIEFVARLSPATRYKRGGTRIEELTPALAHERVAPDPERELAFVAVARRGGESRIVGVARCRRRDDSSWEFMIVVADDWQRRGIGRRLMSVLDAEMPRRGAAALDGVVLATNRGMLDFVGPSEEGAMFKRAVKEFAAGTG